LDASQSVAVAQSAKRSTRDPPRAALERLACFDRSVFDVGRPRVRIRVEDGAEHDVVIDDVRGRGVERGAAERSQKGLKEPRGPDGL
jgi:hypothetical protein